MGYVAGSSALKCIHESGSELRERYACFYLEDGSDRLENDIRAARSVYKILLDRHDVSILYDIDIGDDGLFSALWTLGEKLNTGLKVYLDKIPIRQISIELAEYFDKNPYELESKGTFLLVAEADEETFSDIQADKLSPVRIGCLTDDRARVIIGKENIRYLNRD